MPNRIDVVPNVEYEKPMPMSEVCMHMKVVDLIFSFRLENNSVQLYDGVGYSAPITPGEAGLMYDRFTKSYYFYEGEA